MRQREIKEDREEKERKIEIEIEKKLEKKRKSEEEKERKIEIEKREEALPEIRNIRKSILSLNIKFFIFITL